MELFLGAEHVHRPRQLRDVDARGGVFCDVAELAIALDRRRHRRLPPVCFELV